MLSSLPVAFNLFQWLTVKKFIFHHDPVCTHVCLSICTTKTEVSCILSLCYMQCVLAFKNFILVSCIKRERAVPLDWFHSPLMGLRLWKTFSFSLLYGSWLEMFFNFLLDLAGCRAVSLLLRHAANYVLWTIPLVEGSSLIKYFRNYKYLTKPFAWKRVSPGNHPET